MIAVDLFAGWGGFTAGAEAAGVRVAWAANHWPLAVRAHAFNHPGTAHACQDLRQADWSALPHHDLLLASPACQGHSSAAQPSRAASGGVRRRHDAMRATAWAVVDCAEVCAPRALVVENVPAFTQWPLFPVWCDALRRLGYQLAAVRLVASRVTSTPQRRDRLFVIGTRRRVPDSLRTFAEHPEPAIGPHLQWDAGAWSPVGSATPAVRARIAAAQRRHGPRCVTQHVTGHPGVGLGEPLRTVTTKDQWALVDRDRYRPLTVRETARAMGFPDAYRWPDGATRRDQITGLGNAVCPPVAALVVGRIANTL